MEIVNAAADLGIGIKYRSLLRFHESWVLDELEKGRVCPEEIAYKKPGTVIIDNDDFKDDDLTGGTTSHRTNMMFVQPKKWINEEKLPSEPLEKNATDKRKEK